MPFQKKIEIREHNGPIYSVVGDGYHIFTSSGDKYIVKWNLETGEQERFSIKMDNVSYCLAYADSVLCIGTKQGECYLINDATKEIIAQRKVTHCAIHSIFIGEQIIIGNEAGELLFLDLQLNELAKIIFDSGKIRNLKLLDANRLLVCSQDGYLRILLLDSKELEHRFLAHEMGLNNILVDNERIITVGKDGYLKVWNWQEELLLNAWPIHYETIYDIQKVGDYLVTVSRDKSIKIWEYNSDLKLVQKITSRHFGHSYSVNCIHVIDEDNFCTVGDDKRIILWSFDAEEINLKNLLQNR